MLVKAKMWAISSDTHQLHYIPKHHFIIQLQLGTARPRTRGLCAGTGVAGEGGVVSRKKGARSMGEEKKEGENNNNNNK